jgi:hypothetical protein
MANLLGPNDMKTYALPTYWDAATLTQFRLRSGETYEQLLNEAIAALGIVNGQLLNDPLYASLMSTTDELAIEYPIGTTNAMEQHGEYTRPDPQRGKTTGHMLELGEYDYQLSWTWDALRKARMLQITNDVSIAAQAVKDNFHKRLLQRLFKSTYTTVGSGRSMPLADGGTADSAYVPPHKAERASAFAYTHSHLGCASGITQANLETGVAHVWEHGFDAPFDLLVAQADIGSWTDVTSVTGYVKPASGLVRYGATTDLAMVGDGVLGVIETDYGPVRVRASARVPTAYYAVYKSFGPGDPRNPLVVRYDPQFGAGAILLRGDHIREFPLENAIIFHAFGAGIANRVGAWLCYNTTPGSYTDPTIT